MFKESLTSRPELENSQGHERNARGHHITSALASKGDLRAAAADQRDRN
jgi:hypothetical protein